MDKKISKRFQKLLLQFSQEASDEGRQKVEAQLWDEYGSEQVVFVLDMSGFSLLTRKYGIVHYLSMVRRMQLTVEPIIEAYEGNVLKFEADNCLALFPDTLPAIRAGIAMQLALDASNLLTPDDLDVRISCGIDYGKILMIGNEDCFGDAVNRAYKLGEDVAAANEILVTREAMDRVHPEADIKRHPVNVSISGITIPAYAIEYRSQ
ncbi:MAG: adenylate/guanylate cyclase domain-containing protein [Anaerolineales bacterium]|nr:adenylate/guanylate cyclase domain-containing protein [Anaerolineales bacterium]